MSQYYNPWTGHLATDCPHCGCLIEMLHAQWGMKTQCTQCGTVFEAVPVVVTVRSLDGKREYQVEKALRLEPLQNG